MWLGTTKNRTFNAEKPPFWAVFLKKGGPSDRIRTCGILLPKQARYQLRYTRLFSLFIRLVVFSQTRRDTNFAIPGYSISAMIPRRRGKSKIFLSVVIPVVKATFMPFSATGGKPAIARTARLCGLLSKPRMDRVYALPNVARYQLRHTRIGEGYAARSRTAYPYYIRFSPVLQGGNQPFRAAFRAATRSVASQRTPRSSRPMWP